MPDPIPAKDLLAAGAARAASSPYTSEQRDIWAETATDLAGELDHLQYRVQQIARRLHETLMAQRDYTRLDILDDLRALVPDTMMKADEDQ